MALVVHSCYIFHAVKIFISKHGYIGALAVNPCYIFMHSFETLCDLSIIYRQ